MNAEDYIAGFGFGFGAGETVVRLRARGVLDRYADAPVRADWTDPDRLTITGASISSLAQGNADDTQRRRIDVSALLTVTDPGADVLLGDRIERGTETWEVVERPETDVNPFTGWRPTLVVALREVLG